MDARESSRACLNSLSLRPQILKEIGKEMDPEEISCCENVTLTSGFPGFTLMNF